MHWFDRHGCTNMLALVVLTASMALPVTADGPPSADNPPAVDAPPTENAPPADGAPPAADGAGDDSAESKSTPSILEQRRAFMRGDAMGRAPVEVRRSTAAEIAKGDITFDDLKFDIEKGQPFDKEQLNDVIKSLNGRTVRLRGYILPTTLFRESDIREFVLVRDNLECCFGPGAALFDCVMIEMKPGKSTDYVTRTVTVEGKFVIDADKYQYPGGKGPDGGSHLAVFRIEGIAVR